MTLKRTGSLKQFKTIDDFNFSGKRVLLRADLNVPIQDDVITDTTRIARTIPTILELQEKGAQVIVMSHFGRPKGPQCPEMSLKPIAAELGRYLNQVVIFSHDCIGQEAMEMISAADRGSVIMLENLRFHSEEEANDENFAKQISDLADIYVNNAFSCAHRAHASTAAITRFLPSAAGRLMQYELEALNNALGNPAPPVAALVGGAKISSKIEVLVNLVSKVDQLIIGGGMANTFLHSKGINIGKSLCETDMIEQAQSIMKNAMVADCEIVLPIDAVVAPKLEIGIKTAVVPINLVPPDHMILDVGPHSIKDLVKRLETYQTIVWNGPLGAFEVMPFDKGTNAVAREAARLTRKGDLLSVAGGGDTIAALANAGVIDNFSYISTAGGAFLEWLEGKTLPGIAALND